MAANGIIRKIEEPTDSPFPDTCREKWCVGGTDGRIDTIAVYRPKDSDTMNR